MINNLSEVPKHVKLGYKVEKDNATLYRNALGIVLKNENSVSSEFKAFHKSIVEYSNELFFQRPRKNTYNSISNTLTNYTILKSDYYKHCTGEMFKNYCSNLRAYSDKQSVRRPSKQVKKGKLSTNKLYKTHENELSKTVNYLNEKYSANAHLFYNIVNNKYRYSNAMKALFKHIGFFDKQLLIDYKSKVNWDYYITINPWNNNELDGGTLRQFIQDELYPSLRKAYKVEEYFDNIEYYTIVGKSHAHINLALNQKTKKVTIQELRNFINNQLNNSKILAGDKRAKVNIIQCYLKYKKVGKKLVPNPTYNNFLSYDIKEVGEELSNKDKFKNLISPYSDWLGKGVFGNGKYFLYSKSKSFELLARNGCFSVPKAYLATDVSVIVNSIASTLNAEYYKLNILDALVYNYPIYLGFGLRAKKNTKKAFLRKVFWSPKELFRTISTSIPYKERLSLLFTINRLRDKNNELIYTIKANKYLYNARAA